VAPGGKVLEIIDTRQPCYACMLGGDDGRTLSMLTAPPANLSTGPVRRPESCWSPKSRPHTPAFHDRDGERGPAEPIAFERNANDTLTVWKLDRLTRCGFSRLEV